MTKLEECIEKIHFDGDISDNKYEELCKFIEENNKELASKIYDAVTNKLISLETDLRINQAIQDVILDFIYS